MRFPFTRKVLMSLGIWMTVFTAYGLAMQLIGNAIARRLWKKMEADLEVFEKNL